MSPFRLTLAALLIAAAPALAADKPAPAAKPGVAVTTTAVKRQAKPVELRAVGTVTSPASVAVRARVDGQIDKVHVQDGAAVKEGALLVTLDRRPQDVAVSQAEAAVARSQAALDSARRELNRLSPLADREFAPRQQLDNAKTAVETATAALRLDQANLAGARLQLSFTEIKAPVTGRAGIVNMPKGNLVRGNDVQPLVVINQISPIEVAFALPQKELPAIRAAQGAGPLAVEVTAQGDSQAARGQMSFIDNAIDQTTGTVKLKASFPNQDERLWPGQLVDVRLLLATQTDALVVPASAVQQSQNGPYVYVVDANQQAEMRPVVVDRVLGGDTVIAKGVAEGEIVVVDGHFRLAPGMKVAKGAGQ